MAYQPGWYQHHERETSVNAESDVQLREIVAASDKKRVFYKWNDGSITSLTAQAFNVLDYGAYGGHLGTIHDELIPIQNCIRAAVSAGVNAVYLPSGDYGISNTIDLHALLGISNSLANQGYFTLYGDNPGTTRIIPTANITGAMIECVNAGTGNAANGRDFRFRGFSLYSDARLNKSADYGFHFKWCAQVFYTDVNVINCCNKRLVWHDTTFVVNISNCNFVGKANELADAGSGGAPDGPSNAMNSPPTDHQERLTALYFTNTSTTTMVDSCRMQSCRYGVNNANGDMFVYQNCAIESNADFGLWISGSVTNINAYDNYWEDNTSNIKITARCDSVNIEGNFLHGGAYGIWISAASLYELRVIGNNFFSSTYGIFLDEPSIYMLEVEGNKFDIDQDELIWVPDNLTAYGNQGLSRVDWDRNVTTNITHLQTFSREDKNLNQIDFQDWTLSSGSITSTHSTKKNKIANVYNITAPTQADFLYTTLMDIGSSVNKNLLGSWITVILPTYFNSITSYNDTGVTFSNSGGNLLCTHTSDFPNGSAVRFSGGVLPSGILVNTNYTVVRISATTCNLDAGSGNIAYTNSGSGSINMDYYQPGGKLYINDGTVAREYLLNTQTVSEWKDVRAYFKIDPGASTLDIRLYASGANFDVENIVILKGLWGDSDTRASFHEKLYVHPALESSKRPIRLYQGPNSEVVIAGFDNPGSPSYGLMFVNDQDGSRTIECNGGPGSILSMGPTGGVGYTTGAGGAVSQSSSKTTAVTLNKVTGKITLDGGALGAGTSASFTLTNSAIAATDVLVMNHASGGTDGAYTLNARCGTGSAVITVRNVTTGSLSEAIVIGFVLVKGAIS